MQPWQEPVHNGVVAVFDGADREHADFADEHISPAPTIHQQQQQQQQQPPVEPVTVSALPADAPAAASAAGSNTACQLHLPSLQPLSDAIAVEPSQPLLQQLLKPLLSALPMTHASNDSSPYTAQQSAPEGAQVARTSSQPPPPLMCLQRSAVAHAAAPAEQQMNTCAQDTERQVQQAELRAPAVFFQLPPTDDQQLSQQVMLPSPRLDLHQPPHACSSAQPSPRFGMRLTVPPSPHSQPAMSLDPKLWQSQGQPPDTSSSMQPPQSAQHAAQPTAQVQALQRRSFPSQSVLQLPSDTWPVQPSQPSPSPHSLTSPQLRLSLQSPSPPLMSPTQQLRLQLQAPVTAMRQLPQHPPPVNSQSQLLWQLQLQPQLLPMLQAQLVGALANGFAGGPLLGQQSRQPSNSQLQLQALGALISLAPTHGRPAALFGDGSSLAELDQPGAAARGTLRQRRAARSMQQAAHEAAAEHVSKPRSRRRQPAAATGSRAESSTDSSSGDNQQQSAAEGDEKSDEHKSAPSASPRQRRQSREQQPQTSSSDSDGDHGGRKSAAKRTTSVPLITSQAAKLERRSLAAAAAAARFGDYDQPPLPKLAPSTSSAVLEAARPQRRRRVAATASAMLSDLAANVQAGRAIAAGQESSGGEEDMCKADTGSQHRPRKEPSNRNRRRSSLSAGRSESLRRTGVDSGGDEAADAELGAAAQVSERRRSLGLHAAIVRLQAHESKIGGARAQHRSPSTAAGQLSCCEVTESDARAKLGDGSGRQSSDAQSSNHSSGSGGKNSQPSANGNDSSSSSGSEVIPKQQFVPASGPRMRKPSLKVSVAAEEVAARGQVRMSSKVRTRKPPVPKGPVGSAEPAAVADAAHAVDMAVDVKVQAESQATLTHDAVHAAIPVRRTVRRRRPDIAAGPDLSLTAQPVQLPLLFGGRSGRESSGISSSDISGSSSSSGSDSSEDEEEEVVAKQQFVPASGPRARKPTARSLAEQEEAARMKARPPARPRSRKPAAVSVAGGVAMLVATDAAGGSSNAALDADLANNSHSCAAATSSAVVNLAVAAGGVQGAGDGDSQAPAGADGVSYAAPATTNAAAAGAMQLSAPSPVRQPKQHSLSGAAPPGSTLQAVSMLGQHIAPTLAAGLTADPAKKKSRSGSRRPRKTALPAAADGGNARATSQAGAAAAPAADAKPKRARKPRVRKPKVLVTDNGQPAGGGGTAESLADGAAENGRAGNDGLLPVDGTGTPGKVPRSRSGKRKPRARKDSTAADAALIAGAEQVAQSGEVLKRKRQSGKRKPGAVRKPRRRPSAASDHGGADPAAVSVNGTSAAGTAPAETVGDGSAVAVGDDAVNGSNAAVAGSVHVDSPAPRKRVDKRRRSRSSGGDEAPASKRSVARPSGRLRSEARPRGRSRSRPGSSPSGSQPLPQSRPARVRSKPAEYTPAEFKARAARLKPRAETPGSTSDADGSAGGGDGEVGISAAAASLRRKRKEEQQRLGNPHFARVLARARRQVARIVKEQHLIDALGAEGWQPGRKKVALTAETSRAEAALAHAREAVRTSVRACDEQTEVKPISAELFDADGELDEAHIFCGICLQGDSTEGNDIILCDGPCNCAYHERCLQPPIVAAELPEDEGWLCPACDCKADILEAINGTFDTEYSINDLWDAILPAAQPNQPPASLRRRSSNGEAPASPGAQVDGDVSEDDDPASFPHASSLAHTSSSPVGHRRHPIRRAAAAARHAALGGGGSVPNGVVYQVAQNGHAAGIGGRAGRGAGGAATGWLATELPSEDEEDEDFGEEDEVEEEDEEQGGGPPRAHHGNTTALMKQVAQGSNGTGSATSSEGGASGPGSASSSGSEDNSSGSDDEGDSSRGRDVSSASTISGDSGDHSGISEEAGSSEEGVVAVQTSKARIPFCRGVAKRRTGAARSRASNGADGDGEGVDGDLTTSEQGDASGAQMEHAPEQKGHRRSCSTFTLSEELESDGDDSKRQGKRKRSCSRQAGAASEEADMETEVTDEDEEGEEDSEQEEVPQKRRRRQVDYRALAHQMFGSPTGSAAEDEQADGDFSPSPGARRSAARARL